MVAVTELLHEAARLAQGPEPERARPLIRRLLEAAPAHPDGLTLLGMVEQRAGNIPAALDAFGRALGADPDNPARLGNHAIALKAAGRPNEAITALERSLGLRPGAPAALNNLGSCLLAADRAREAEAPLRQALGVKRDYPEAWNNLGVSLARQGRAEEAAAAYDEALRLRPDYVEAAINRVEALVAAGRSADAEAFGADICRRHPTNARAANVLAGLLDKAGRLAEAEKIYAMALAMGGPSMPLGANLAMAQLRLGKYDEALDLCDRLIAALPGITTPLALKSVALHKLSRSDELDALMGINRFVRVIDLDRVSGYDSVEAFNAALVAELRAHPSLTFEPEGLVTRKGRQSDDLLRDAGPAVAALATIAGEAARDYAANLRDDDHPFVRAAPCDWTLTMWGTILSPGGAVDSHIHAPNWLSGVYYPQLLPPAALTDSREGWFTIGSLPQLFGGEGGLRDIAPLPGRMVLFPSYYYHRTRDFGGTEERISFAFDVVPAGIGRPHRLGR